MASAVKGVRSEADFPEVPPFGVWWKGSQSFTTYTTLAAVKGAITNSIGWRDMFAQDIQVYEWVGNAWVLIDTMATGDIRVDHPLWKNGKAPAGIAVSDESVEEAIESILKSARKEDS